MRKFIRRIIEILDDTPADYGKRRSRGQSLVEMAFISPLLIMLFAGIVEIGWYANNYLNLLETARVGARAGTVQEGDNTPLRWEERLAQFNVVEELGGLPAVNNPVRDCGYIAANEDYAGFYNILMCLMVNAIQPLEIRDDITSQDDIVISVFAIQSIDNTDGDGDGDINLNNPVPSAGARPQRVRQPIVVGRYPANANECTVDDGGGYIRIERDPFDYIENNSLNTRSIDLGGGVLRTFPLELIRNPAEPDPAGWIEFRDDSFERQRGFVLYGNHRVSNTAVNCYGSEWDVARMETLMNLPELARNNPTGSLTADEREWLPNQGIVLVEIFWQHELLLQIPLFSPVFDILGPSTIISVWSAFPVPSAEPRIRFE